MASTEYFGYKHWTLEEIPRCFNVGKGNVGRSHRSDNRNHKWHAIVKRFGFRVEVCLGPVTNEEACAWEIEQIVKENTFSTNHSHNDASDIGCNLTRGGDGISGWYHSDKSRLKMSASHKGIPLSIDHCESIRRSHVGVFKSDAHRVSLSVSNMGKNTGRFAGEKHHATKLTDAAVLEIRDRWLKTAVTRQQLSTEFDVNVSVLSGILTGHTFKHLLHEDELKKLRYMMQG